MDKFPAAWVLDLIAAVEQFEETHPTADECLAEAISAVPAEVRSFAAGYARGKRDAKESHDG